MENIKERLFETINFINRKYDLNEGISFNVDEEVIRSTNSDSPEIDLNKKYSNNLVMQHKPKGLWYQLDDDWTRWCSYEMPEWLKKYDIHIDLDMSSILVLDSKEKVKEFIEMYEDKKSISSFSRTIKWNDVAQNYKGIEIPNIWKVKHVDDMDFLYAWDVNSGCIWDLSAIKGYKAQDCNVKGEEY